MQNYVSAVGFIPPEIKKSALLLYKKALETYHCIYNFIICVKSNALYQMHFYIVCMFILDKANCNIFFIL